MQVKNFVFEGGGMKGIAYAGAIAEIEKRGVLQGVAQVAGASAGAITAAFLAVGGSAAEIEQILHETTLSREVMDTLVANGARATREWFERG